VVSTLVTGSNGPGYSPGSAATRAYHLFGSRPWHSKLNLVRQDRARHFYPIFFFISICKPSLVSIYLVTVTAILMLLMRQTFLLSQSLDFLKEDEKLLSAVQILMNLVQVLSCSQSQMGTSVTSLQLTPFYNSETSAGCLASSNNFTKKTRSASRAVSRN
jgi:hypothetical protein